MMDNDRELLERAAKAAGLAYEHDWGGVRVDPEFNEFYAWRPLTDDGDALRLAVKLRLSVEPSGDFGCSVSIVTDEDPFGRELADERGQDPYAATRRAIVRAAAAIGGAT